MSNQAKKLADIKSMTPEARYDYFVEQVKQHKVLWSLQDSEGCVMLTTEEEDCIPLWPSEETAKMWAVDDWKTCEPFAIPLEEWQSRWVSGMEDDDLFVAVLPMQDDLGVVVPPFEVNERLTPKTKH
ncbi:DUF2750 domain-containing protein [Shewanella gelidii]|uniref:DUF2750 domain-containing protein n=1 Tax=Shewanella gelidii TaxID=1642821 RepID=A0A917JKL3_9GAMM|nr:DUF2750 domain-containing protein [Shewanella gelidii]MCL1096702.1 DUF2750 domain-containing protein [Shewanella gelidii]GGI69606.1 DUF2750 domain-containing protein [Shewanella gelidii]